MADKRIKSVKWALDGHSFIITGQCGTGKTYLLRQIIQTLSATKKVVAVTATTGMASLQPGHKATTLHHWAGILDGRHNEDTLSDLFQNDDSFAQAKMRIRSTDILIIDEISMLSMKIFEMVDFVCRISKGTRTVFGAIQVIGCGDFKQLPPVPNERYDDNGKYCFESRIFKQTIIHHIFLKEVKRQNEIMLITAVNELCDGMPSKETIAFLKSLDRPLDVPDSEVTKLYGSNFDAKVINQIMLEQLDGEMFSFHAKDEGDVRFLRRSPAHQQLLLKVGAKVILIKNMENGLFNGMQGIVHQLTNGQPPIVNFNGNIVTVNVPIQTFDIYDARAKRTLASRSQVPLLLAYALTVHRAQGQTLQYVEIDCYGFFAAGMMGVAVGRAVSSDALSIVNFNRSAAFSKHLDVVSDFYDEPFKHFSEDVKCCTRHFLPTHHHQSG